MVAKSQANHDLHACLDRTKTHHAQLMLKNSKEGLYHFHPATTDRCGATSTKNTYYHTGLQQTGMPGRVPSAYAPTLRVASSRLADVVASHRHPKKPFRARTADADLSLQPFPVPSATPASPAPVSTNSAHSPFLSLSALSSADANLARSATRRWSAGGW